MSRFHAFIFSEPVDLSARLFVIKDVGQDPPVTLYSSSLSGSVTKAEMELPDNRMCEATLTDTRNGGDFAPRIFKFNTTSDHPMGISGTIQYAGAEEASSSSSTSSLSSSSSSSSSSSTSSLSSLSSSSSSSSSHSRSSSSSLSSSSS